MNFEGEPEIAVVSQDHYEETNIVNKTPCYCNGKLWVIISQNNDTHFCLAAQQQQHYSGGNGGTDSRSHVRSANSDGSCDDDGAFVEITSFPPAPRPSAGTTGTTTTSTTTASAVSSSSSSPISDFVVLSRSVLVHSPTSTTMRNFVVAIRQSDGVFVVADADMQRAAGMGVLSDENGEAVSVSCAVSDEDRNRLFVFTQSSPTHSTASASTTTTSTTKKQQETDSSKKNRIENSIFAIQLFFPNPAADVAVKVVECLCFQTSSRLLTAKLIPDTNTIVVAREGGIVELFSRKLIVKFLNSSHEQDHHLFEEESDDVLLLSRVTLQSATARTAGSSRNNTNTNTNNYHCNSHSFGEVTCFAIDHNTGNHHRHHNNNDQKASQTTTTTTAPTTEKISGNDNNRNNGHGNSGILAKRIFCCTSLGNVAVLLLNLIPSEASSSSSSPSSPHSSRVLYKLAPRVGKVLRVVPTSCSIASAVVACSTIWFSDESGSVRIWSLDTLEELGTLDSSVGPGGATEDQEGAVVEHDVDFEGDDGLAASDAPSLSSSPSTSPSSSSSSPNRKAKTLDQRRQEMKSNTTSSSKPKHGKYSCAQVLELSELECRQNIAVFRKRRTERDDKNHRCDLQSLAVKQGVVLVPPSIHTQHHQRLVGQGAHLVQSHSSAIFEVDASPSVPPQPSHQIPQPMSSRNGTNKSRSSSSTNTLPGAAASGSPPSSTLPQQQQPQQQQQRSTSAASSSTTNQESPSPSSISSATFTFIKQLCNILTDNKKQHRPDHSHSHSHHQQQPPLPVVAVPEKVLRQIPESEYLESALSSVATCSAIIGQTLPDLNLRPSSLTQDVALICDMTVRMYRNENRLKKVMGGLEKELLQKSQHIDDPSSSNFTASSSSTVSTTTSSSSSAVAAVDGLTSICQRLVSKHDEEVKKLRQELSLVEVEKSKAMEAITRIETERDADASRLREEIRRLKEKVDDLEKQQRQQQHQQDQQQRHKSRAFPHESIAPPLPAESSYPTADQIIKRYEQDQQRKSSASSFSPQNSESYDQIIAIVKQQQQTIDKLQSDLTSKSSLVKHLMQLTNDNGKVIDEMRQHAIQRRDEAVELRRRIREVEDRHVFFIEASVREIDKMLETFTGSTSTTTSNLRSVVFMLQGLKQKLVT